MFKLSAALATALFAATLPALANPGLDNPVGIMPVPIMLPRDSDGITISVLHLYDFHLQPGSTGGIAPGGVYYSFDTPVSTSAGGVSQPRGGPALTGQPVFLGGSELLTAGAKGAVLDVGGVAYQVEAKGNRVWLRDIATGTRHAAARHTAPVSPDTQGLSVNPAQFGLG